MGQSLLGGAGSILFSRCRQSVGACVRLSCSYCDIFALMEFYQTFVNRAFWDKGVQISFWGQKSRFNHGKTYRAM